MNPDHVNYSQFPELSESTICETQNPLNEQKVA